MQTTDYTISKARYAKGKMKIHIPATGCGFKNRAMRLADAIARGRYSGREQAWIVSPTAAKKFETLFTQGWDACVMTYKLEAPDPKTNSTLDAPTQSASNSAADPKTNSKLAVSKSSQGKGI